MGIDPNVGGNIGFNINGGDAPETIVPSGDSGPVVEEQFISSLSKSELDRLIINLIASYPMLGQFPLASLFDNIGANGQFSKAQVDGFVASMSSTQHDIVNKMLDAWIANEQMQAEMQREDALKTQQRNNQEQTTRLKDQVLRQEIEKESTVPLQADNPHIKDAANYMTYLATLSTPRRADEVGNIAHRIVDHYLSVSNDPALQNSDLAKAVLPLMVMQTLVISPGVQQLMIPSVELSSQIGVNPIADQVRPAMLPLPNVFQDQTLLTINLFVMDMVKNATIDMYLRNAGNAATKPEDIAFATAFATQMLEKVRTPGYIEGELLKNASGVAQMPWDQLQVAVALVKSFALLNAVMLFVKVEGGTLQERELKEYLTGTTDIPTGDNRAELLSELRGILDSIPNEKQVDFAQTLLKYVGSMPDTDRLTNWVHALNAAMKEITPVQRALQTASD